MSPPQVHGVLAVQVCEQMGERQEQELPPQVQGLEGSQGTEQFPASEQLQVLPPQVHGEVAMHGCVQVCVSQMQTLPPQPQVGEVVQAEATPPQALGDWQPQMLPPQLQP